MRGKGSQSGEAKCINDTRKGKVSDLDRFFSFSPETRKRTRTIRASVRSTA